MTDLVLPAVLRQARARFRYIDNSGLTRGWGSNFAQVTDFGGDGVGLSIDFTPHGGKTTTGRRELAQMSTLMMALHGKQHCLFAGQSGYTARGTFTAQELFANPEFANGTTSWSVTGTGAATAADGVLRLKASAGGGQPSLYQDATVVAFAPYVLRAMVNDGAGSAGLQIGIQIAADVARSIVSATLNTTRGYKLASIVTVEAGSIRQFPAYFNATSGYQAGSYVDISHASLSRCLLADGGGCNTLHSDDLSNAAWTKGQVTVTANLHTAPDGTATADRITEDTNAGTHGVNQSAARTNVTADLVSWGYFSRSSGTRNIRLWVGNDGTDGGSAIFNLLTGAISAQTNHGAATNVRAYSRDVGSGYFLCYVVARLPAAATIRIFAEMENNAGTVSYTGDGSSRIAAWRLGARIGSVPPRAVASTTAAVAAESQTGPAIYVSGGRTPTEGALDGALSAGDWVEVDGQLKKVTKSLDLDATGRGLLSFSPPLARELADNTPIILHNPMGRFRYAGDSAGFEIEPGIFGRASLELEEAPDL